jgi:putative heme-binding domain-containing protein
MLALVGAAEAQKFVPPVLEMLDNPNLDKALRKAALEALGQIHSPQTLARLEKVLRAVRLPENPPKEIPPTDEMAFAAVAALQTMGTPESSKLLEGLTLDRAYPVDLRRDAVKRLGQTPGGCRFLLGTAARGELPVDVKGDASQVVHRSGDRRLKAMAERVLPLPKLAGNRVLPPIQEILSRTGDAKRGYAVFFKVEAQCSKCHRVDGVGGWIGPDLSQIGGKLGKDGLLDAIINPSAAIAHEYLQYQVETHNGQVFAGLIVDEMPERLILKNAEGERITVPAKEVASKKALPVSIMPEGLVQNFNDRDLVDLLAYLGTLKQAALVISSWQAIGPFAPDVTNAGPEQGVDPKATYPGKGGARVGWRQVAADRDGQLDLEAALGTRHAAVFLYTPVQSGAAQDGRLVVLLPKAAKVSGWLNGRKVKFQPGTLPSDPKALSPAAAQLTLKPGKNELLLKIVGSDEAPLAAVATVVSPQGVEVSLRPDR